jgi:hypothetical protein
MELLEAVDIDIPKTKPESSIEDGEDLVNTDIETATNEDIAGASIDINSDIDG